VCHIIADGLEAIRGRALSARAPFDAVAIRDAAAARIRAEADRLALRSQQAGLELSRVVDTGQFAWFRPAMASAADNVDTSVVHTGTSPPRPPRPAATTLSPIQLAVHVSQYVWAATNDILSRQLAPLAAQISRVSQLLPGYGVAPVSSPLNREEGRLAAVPSATAAPAVAALELILEPDSRLCGRDVERYVEQVARRFVHADNPFVELQVPKDLPLGDRLLITHGAYRDRATGRLLPPLWLTGYGNPLNMWGESRYTA
jgi:hypothetical protein